MFPHTQRTKEAHGSGGFFLFFGGGSYSSVERSKDIVRVSMYEPVKEFYAIKDLRLSDIRIKLDDTCTEPTIKVVVDVSRYNFDTIPFPPWEGHTYYVDEYRFNNTSHHKYYIIKCHPSDWMVDITVPTGKPSKGVSHD